MTSLTARDMCLSYHGSQVVTDASIALRSGAVTTLVGPNGSGKSTLLRCIARLHRPDRGHLQLDDGSSALSLSTQEFARTVTLLSQSRPTPHGVTVRDVVGYGRHPYRSRWRNVDHDGPRAIGWAIEVTGVVAMADRPVDELSGGELQRVWLATCLAQDTQVLLLDEPTTFLDLRYQIEILDLVRDLADAHEVAVGLVLHDLNQAATIGDHVVLLREGRVHASGTPAEVFTEATLTETYGTRIVVTTDPQTGELHARPVGRHTSRLQPV